MYIIAVHLKYTDTNKSMAYVIHPYFVFFTYPMHSLYA